MILDLRHMCKIPSEMCGNKFTGSKDEDLGIFKGQLFCLPHGSQATKSLLGLDFESWKNLKRLALQTLSFTVSKHLEICPRQGAETE